MRALVTVGIYSDLGSEFFQLAFELNESIDVRVDLPVLHRVGRVGCCLGAGGGRLHEAGIDSSKVEDDAVDNHLFM